jgi:YHS domain-containing protein
MKSEGTALHKDPVCGMQVSPKTAAGEAKHQGKSYYFCSAQCREAFNAEPGRYVSGRREGVAKSKT